MILVTGASGGLGSAVINALLDRIPSDNIAALVRDDNSAEKLKARGVDARIGDYDSYESLLKAFQGVEKLLLVSAPALSDQRYAQESNVVKAASEAGVKHIFFTGIQRNREYNFTMPFVTEISDKIEKLIKETDMDYTIVENTIYADSVTIYVGEKVLEKGVNFPAGQGRIAYATRADLGEGLAVLLIQDGHQNKKYTFTNNQSWSFSDIASIISKLSGKELIYNDMARELFIPHRVDAEGLPEFVAEFLADWGAAAKSGEFEEIDPLLESLLGRKPVSLEEYLSKIYIKN